MDPFIAQIIMFGGNFAPRGWALCDGQLLQIAQHSALFSILGTTYGGDGRTTFGLPDLRSRVAMHAGHGPGLSSVRLGQKGGVERVTLIESQIPAHDHNATSVAHAKMGAGDSNDAVSHFWADDAGVSSATYATAADAQMAAGAVTTTIQNAGGSGSHENLQPYLAVNFIIALVGTFPSRN